MSHSDPCVTVRGSCTLVSKNLSTPVGAIPNFLLLHLAIATNQDNHGELLIVLHVSKFTQPHVVSSNTNASLDCT
ncbi:unnamed protein product [Allacma fusca]|uniref:Uncharacterized protein n=1 Tax=Allacma fusca TaxID=39272 RepID=A0A8J2LAZ4_9HEXA|nr:unnamed protein product [Allacma fusca]